MAKFTRNYEHEPISSLIYLFLSVKTYQSSECCFIRRLLTKRFRIIKHCSQFLFKELFGNYSFICVDFRFLLSSDFVSVWLRCGTRPYEWGTQWNSSSLAKVCFYSLRTITPPETSMIIAFIFILFQRRVYIRLLDSNYWFILWNTIEYIRCVQFFKTVSQLFFNLWFP